MGWLSKILSPKQATPQIDYNNLLRSYGAILEATAGEPVTNANVLPIDKETLEATILAALSQCTDADFYETLKVGFVSLGNFVQITNQEQIVLDKLSSEFNNSGKSVGLDSVNYMAENGHIQIALMQKAEQQRKLLIAKLQKWGYL